MSPFAAELIEQLAGHPGYELAGIIAERSDNPQQGRQWPILGTLADFDRIVNRVKPDLIVVATADRRGSVPVRQLLECHIRNGVEVVDGAALYEQLIGALEVSTMTPAGVLFSRDFQPSRWRRLSTRALGLVVSAMASVVVAPVCLVIALAIKLDSPGPVFFIQERLGAFARPFKLIKFRTMTPTSACTSEWVRDNTGRITRVGAWLRKFRLDELPQLINVFKGDMNLVGPRPHPIDNSETLTMLARNLCEMSGIDIPYYSLRCQVRPGITGWAQVRYGYANDFAEELEKLRYDLYYVKHCSLRLDVRILFETVNVVLRGRDSTALARPAAELPAADTSRLSRKPTHAKTA